MAAGGYTGRGGKYDPKGIVVHGDEHVVPSEGLPVIRGDQPGMSKLVDLLGQLVSIAQQTADRAPAAVDIQLKMPGQAIPVTQRSRAKV